MVDSRFVLFPTVTRHCFIEFGANMGGVSAAPSMHCVHGRVLTAHLASPNSKWCGDRGAHCGWLILLSACSPPPHAIALSWLAPTRAAFRQRRVRTVHAVVYRRRTLRRQTRRGADIAVHAVMVDAPLPVSRRPPRRACSSSASMRAALRVRSLSTVRAAAVRRRGAQRRARFVVADKPVDRVVDSSTLVSCASLTASHSDLSPRVTILGQRIECTVCSAVAQRRPSR